MLISFNEILAWPPQWPQKEDSGLFQKLQFWNQHNKLKKLSYSLSCSKNFKLKSLPKRVAVWNDFMLLSRIHFHISFYSGNNFLLELRYVIVNSQIKFDRWLISFFFWFGCSNVDHSLKFCRRIPCPSHEVSSQRVATKECR